MENFVIPTTTVAEDFNKFIDTEDNSRILFSGKYGIGKTYFLDNFFKEKEENYDVYHLYPVNYQISCNEDVLELIKYDILVELLLKNKDIFKEKNPKTIKESTLLFVSWLKERITINSVLKHSITTLEDLSGLLPGPYEYLGKLGRPLKDLLEIDKEYQEFKKGEKGEIQKYTEEIKKKNVSETDYISFLLREKINLQKGNKKSVLILDDFDRIDPEHIFRVLNILSSCFGKDDENENKFGFDRIIIVADISNIKSIFLHKYGQSTDFYGYINKFYTVEPYFYNNKKAILNSIDNIIGNVKNENDILINAMNQSGYIRTILSYLFSKAIECEKMNLRQILKPNRYLLASFRNGSVQRMIFDSNKKIFDLSIKIADSIFDGDTLEIIKTIKSNIKKLYNDEMPFGFYIRIMFKAMKITAPNETKGQLVWNGYRISEDKMGDDELKEETGKKEELFCDLLIDYIENKRYLEDTL